MDLHYITQIQTAMKNCIKFLNKIDVAPVTCVLNFKCTSLTHLYFFCSPGLVNFRIGCACSNWEAIASSSELETFGSL